MAQKGKGNTVSRVTEIIRPFADEMGLALWDVRFLKEGASWYLRIFIDKDGGVDINDCADFSRKVNKPLDDADLIDQSYILEVSSPGIERELVKEAHFLACLGQKVLLRSIRPIDGARDFAGTLKSYENGVFTVELPDGGALTLTVKETSFVKLDDFNMDDFR